MRFALLRGGKFYLFDANSLEEGEQVAECMWAMLDGDAEECWIPKEVSNEAVGTTS